MCRCASQCSALLYWAYTCNGFSQLPFFSYHVYSVWPLVFGFHSLPPSSLREPFRLTTAINLDLGIFFSSVI